MSGAKLADGTVSNLSGHFYNAMTPVPRQKLEGKEVSQSGGSLTTKTEIYSFGDDSHV